MKIAEIEIDEKLKFVEFFEVCKTNLCFLIFFFFLKMVVIGSRTVGCGGSDGGLN